MSEQLSFFYEKGTFSFRAILSRQSQNFRVLMFSCFCVFMFSCKGSHYMQFLKEPAENGHAMFVASYQFSLAVKTS